MPHTAPIRTHRKPRRNAPKTALRAGVAGGVLSTIAVAGAAGTAHAEPVTETIEMPTLSADLSSTVAQSAQATQQIALTLQTRAQLQSQEDTAVKNAATAAKKAKSKAEAEAKAKAAAEAKKKAEEAARAKAAAAARASRSSVRTELASTSSNTTPTSSSSSSATGSAGAIVSFVEAHIGDAYVMGSTGPNAFDCSGLVQAAYRTVGVDLPRVSQDQSTAGTQVGLGNLQPGDILYWGSAGSAYHVAIYVGDGKFVGAQNPSSGVVEHDLSYDQPTGAVRVL
ncbi:C40 family peptidase [Streptomyces fuscigenes]|uniref:C40 family peptidase n=1 Tax=Streptomyces fuscigenes TaxID=1528880 RepID=UPI001F2E8BD2|nr:C40 family peptidase [Streptomyces fuscigenes]MCF3962805.1 C40 family peptidase [Streptomyces fuscigenes]